ncbi:hypothetical protein ACWD4O_39030 [Streptomyces sp. NPDC002623]
MTTYVRYNGQFPTNIILAFMFCTAVVKTLTPEEVSGLATLLSLLITAVSYVRR